MSLDCIYYKVSFEHGEFVIISRTPLRLSLIGGGTDVPAFYEKHTGAVASFAINRFVYVAVNEKFDGRFRVSYSTTENVDTADEIKHDLVRKTLEHFKPSKGLEIVSVADVPGEGTGLGSSSAFECGLLQSLNWYYQQDYLSPGVLAELAFQYERECHPDIGKQDMYAAAYGGFNFMRFHKTHVEVIPLQMTEEWKSGFLLLYTGITRSSSDLLRAQRHGFEKDKMLIGKGMAFLAETFYEQYQSGFVGIGELMRENWDLKMCLYDGVTSPQINAWYELGMKNGAIGGKLCGAGGGGFMLFYAPPDSHKRIVEATGLRKVDFEIENEGSKIVYG